MDLKSIKEFFKIKRNLYIFLLIGVIILLTGNVFSSDKKDNNEITNENTYISDQEDRLEKIL